MKTIQITVYGPGCAWCTTLAENVKEAVQELPGDFEIIKVTNPMEIGEAGVFQTPALAVNGKMLVNGRVPSVAELKEMIQKELPAESPCCCCGSPEPAAPAQPEASCCCTAESDSCGCGGSSCCQGGKGVKAAIIIMAVGLLSVAGIKQFQARQQQAPVAASAPMADNATELVYFTFGMRCPTCVRMEQWSREAAAELNIPFRVDEASAETVERYGLTTKTLILRSLADGEEKDWRNLNRIWELSRDENAFKQYVKNELTAKP